MVSYEPRQAGVPAPKVAWIFYGIAGSSRSDAVCEHPVHVTDKGPVLGAGRPLDQDGLVRAMREAAQGRSIAHTHRGLLPSNVLQFDEQKLTWYVPAKVRRMHWAVAKSGATELSTQTLTVPWPTLVFSHRKGRGLRLFAIRGTRRPGVTTRVYHAPLGNVYRETDVCLGTATRGNLSLESIPVWEEAIFDTRFSHVNQENTLDPQACGLKRDGVSTAAHLRFWKRLHKEQQKRFPSEALCPITDYEGRPLRLGDLLP